MMHRHRVDSFTVLSEYCEDIQATVAAISYSRPITEWLVRCITQNQLLRTVSESTLVAYDPFHRRGTSRPFTTVSHSNERIVRVALSSTSEHACGVAASIDGACGYALR